MSARLSTHVLDLTTGKPAAGMRLELWKRDPMPARLKMVETNQDGRTDVPLLKEQELATGRYELIFFVKEYFSRHATECSFLEDVPIRFSIEDARSVYHVPLLVTPWAYSTYRGS